MNKLVAGFREIEHTADWELQVWAPDLPGLLEMAGRGMYWLMGVKRSTQPITLRVIELEEVEKESLLVQFLNELLFFIESENLIFEQIAFYVHGTSTRVDLEMASIESLDKEIKAVTFHRMKLIETEQGLKVNIVFDV